MFFFYSRPVQEHKIICRINYINTLSKQKRFKNVEESYVQTIMHVQQFEIFYSYQNEKSLKSILVNMKNQHSSDINNDAYLKLKITMLKTVSRKDSETLIRSTRSW